LAVIQKVAILLYFQQGTALHATDQTLRKPVTYTVSIQDSNLVRDSMITLKPVDVQGNRGNQSQEATTLSEKERWAHTGMPVARQLQALPGLTVLASGPQLAKPIVNGLHSQRIVLLQDGFRLEGQQWGSDHAPEMDPFQEGQWQLLESASCLKYGSEALGGVLDLQSPSFLNHQHVDARFGWVAASNRGLWGVHATVQGPMAQGSPWRWRLHASTSTGGNLKVPQSYLANTGSREKALSLELHYSKKRWLVTNQLRLYYLDQGLYPGAHGNTTDDFNRALTSRLPLVPARFTYTLGKPNQEVRHLQWNFSATRNHGPYRYSTLSYSFQDNARKEFDAGSLQVLPELALELGTHQGRYALVHHRGKWRREAGMGVMLQQNINGATSTRQYLRNYQSWNASLYGLISWQATSSIHHEWALRFDRPALTSYYRPPWSGANDAPLIHSRSFFGYSAAWTVTYKPLHSPLTWTLHAGKGWRPPSANELYANGLHQGLAALERGDSNLGPEQTLLLTLGLEAKVLGGTWTSKTGLRRMDGYLLPLPVKPEAVTIQGVYPQFVYAGQKVGFWYWNNVFTLPLGEALRLELAGTVLRSRNWLQGPWMLWMPADRWTVGLHRDWGPRWQSGATVVRVARQSRFPADQDYAPPPAAYTLLSFYVQGLSKDEHWQWRLGIDNAANQSYRDYMNRQRYFFDEPGRNFTLRLRYHLHRHSSKNQVQ